MPGDNFSRRVARAAASGGGRTYRAQTPVTWYLVLLLICLMGVSLVAFSRYELIHPAAAAVKPSVPPTATTEWEDAVEVDICGKFVPSALPLNSLPTNPLASIGNGVVQIDPGVSTQATAYEGAKATLGAYLLIEGATIKSTSPITLSVPGPAVPVPTTTTTTTSTTLGKATSTTSSSSTSTSTSTTTTTTTPTSTSSTSTTKPAKKGTTTTSSSTTTTTTVATEPGPARNFKDGVTKCGSKPGMVMIEMWPSPTSTKGTVIPVSAANGTRFTKNGQMFTIAFLPKGSVIPRPSAAARSAVTTFLLADPQGFATTTVPATIATTSTSSTTSTTVAKKKKTTTTSTSSSTTSTTP